LKVTKRPANLGGFLIQSGEPWWTRTTDTLIKSCMPFVLFPILWTYYNSARLLVFPILSRFVVSRLLCLFPVAIRVAIQPSCSKG